HAGQRTLEALRVVADDGMAVPRVALLVAVGADEQDIHLRHERLDHVLDHGTAGHFHEPLVDAAHARAAAAGEHHAAHPAGTRHVAKGLPGAGRLTLATSSLGGSRTSSSMFSAPL